MAWEKRRNGGRYYTRSRRESGRIVREYVGGGRRGELAAAEDAARRATREAVRLEFRKERARLAHLDELISALHRTTDQLVRGVLYARGFERYKRQWRVHRDHPSNP